MSNSLQENRCEVWCVHVLKELDRYRRAAEKRAREAAQRAIIEGQA